MAGPRNDDASVRPWAVVVQIVVVIAIVVIVWIDQTTEGEPVPTIVYGLLVGIALGLEPNTIKGIFGGGRRE